MMKRFLRVVDLTVFADALKVYIEAAENVRKSGAIIMHPRTGRPIENPYLKIQRNCAAFMAKMARMARIKSDRLMQIIAKASSPLRLQAALVF